MLGTMDGTRGGVISVDLSPRSGQGAPWDTGTWLLIAAPPISHGMFLNLHLRCEHQVTTCHLSQRELQTKVKQRFHNHQWQADLKLGRQRKDHKGQAGWLVWCLYSSPNCGLLRDCEIFANLRLTFVLSSDGHNTTRNIYYLLSTF